MSSLSSNGTEVSSSLLATPHRSTGADLEVPARAAGALERLDLADEDAVHQGAGRHRGRRGDRGVSRPPPPFRRSPVVRGSAMRSLMGTRMNRSSRARSSTGKVFLMPSLLGVDVCVGVADAARTGDTAGGQHQLLELGSGVPFARSISSGVSMSDWRIISPSRQSSNSSWRREVDRADRGCVGDRRGVVRW